MAKRRPRKEATPLSPPASGMGPRQTWGLIVALAAVPFVLGKYGEFKLPGPFDSSGYVYSAQAVLHGARIGVDHRPSAQMGTLLVNMLGVKLFGFSELGPEILQTLFQVVSLVFMGWCLARLYGRLAAGAGVFVASFCLSAPHLAKYGNVKEQFMIACLIVGVSAYVLGRLDRRWVWTLLAGVALSWGPLFKETGTSGLGAVGLFILTESVCRQRPWRAALGDLGLLAAGFVLGVGPVMLWLGVTGVSLEFWPYRSILSVLIPLGGERVGSYVTDARKMIRFGEQGARILRYYGTLLLPIGLALAALVVAGLRTLRRRGVPNPEPAEPGARFVPLFGLWWAIDMAYAWISPRTYEQYFLPLNASAAMCGAYLFGWFACRWRSARNRGPWFAGAAVTALLLVAAGMPLVVGFAHSPHSGSKYRSRQRGYAQRVDEARRHGPGEWERIGDLIRQQTDANDTIYVWGWYPGIYVQAQRLSNAPKAFEGNMHTVSPEELGRRVQDLLEAFAEQAPAFIVDTRKRHFPWNRPPLELWPRMQDPKTRRLRFLDPSIAAQWDAAYGKMLAERIGEDEAQRYAAMKPLRDYVMQHYTVVHDGAHALFKRK